MVWPAVIAGGAQVLGSVAGGLLGRSGAQDANDATARSVGSQNAFQRRVLRNRWRWQRRDMQRAGINPMLAYQQGAGPALSGASFQHANVEAPLGDALADATNSAVSAYRATEEGRKINKDIDKVSADIKQVTEQTENTAENTRVQRAQQKVLAAQERNVHSDTILKNGQAVLNSTQIPLIQKQAELASQNIVLNAIKQNIDRAAESGARHEEQFWKTEHGKALKNWDLTFRALNPFTSTAKDLGNVGVRKR